MLEVRHAAYFIAVAEELHFGRAAARLRMSQPRLIQATKALHRQLGAVLLERTNRSVVITEAGRQFLAMWWTQSFLRPRVSTSWSWSKHVLARSDAFRGTRRFLGGADQECRTRMPS